MHFLLTEDTYWCPVHLRAMTVKSLKHRLRCLKYCTADWYSFYTRANSEIQQSHKFQESQREEIANTPYKDIAFFPINII